MYNPLNYYFSSYCIILCDYYYFYLSDIQINEKWEIKSWISYPFRYTYDIIYKRDKIIHAIIN